MGIDIKIRPELMLDYLKGEGVDIRHIVDAVDAFQDAEGFLKKAEHLFIIAKSVSEAVEWERINGMTVDDAIRIGTKALDELIEFSGTAWGIIPAGAIIDAYDSTIVSLLLKWAYEAIRNRDDQDAEDFADRVRAAFL